MSDFSNRLTAAYEQRKGIPANRYSLWNPATLYLAQQREVDVLAHLKKAGLDNLGDKKILDVGCGAGGELLNFVRYGAIQTNLSGVDILPDRVERAKKSLPAADIACVNAAEGLPWPDSTFDIVSQFTVFTSILEQKIKEQVAAEMRRVLKPGGMLLWYDFLYDSPGNRDVRGIKKAEIEKLFPGFSIQLSKITLAPPITRMVSPYSTILCSFLEKFRLFNTHYLGLMRKI